MTKKHFTAIAESLNNAKQKSINNENAIIHVALELAHKFEQFNPHFDKEKFLEVALA